ncbi:MAG: hypothetical protein OHK0046_05250 [Anaerolineae bacterium]
MRHRRIACTSAYLVSTKEIDDDEEMGTRRGTAAAGGGGVVFARNLPALRHFEKLREHMGT